jgi:hypothetical protein
VRHVRFWQAGQIKEELERRHRAHFELSRLSWGARTAAVLPRIWPRKIVIRNFIAQLDTSTKSHEDRLVV